ncbi:DUF6777 domain-containing protein, partial [Streptomyces sp. NPDC048550]|uniref:DUF6777 domain-containing protein n=1 Tax=Streptomyces sp. NPDC048550 TaxID=3155739 RepID=UPI003427CE84
MATAVVLGFTVIGGNKAVGGEVFLQAASAAGPDPFTPSTSAQSADTGVVPVAVARSNDGTAGARTLEVNGAYPGLYGGTRNLASCDVEKQIQFLGQHKDKAKAFAAPLSIQQPEIPSYLRSLTPVRLGWDTRVTNHGYKNAAPTSYQAVLQAGTPVLVDNRGVPRVRCACGNPLAPPVAVKGKQTYSGKEWSSFQSSDLVAVKPAEKPVKTVMMFDHDRKGWYERSSGDVQGKHDHEVPPPKGQTPDAAYPVLPPTDSGPVQRLPEKGTDKVPERGTDKVPEKGTGQNPERGTDKVPEKGTNQNPEKGTDKVPEKGTNQNPEKGTNQVPEKGTDKVPEKGTNQVPEKVPEKGTDQNPEKGTDKVPEKGTDQNPEKGTDKVPEKGTDKVPEKGTDKVPEKGTDKVPEKGTDKVPEKGTDKVPEKGTDKVPEKGTNQVP